ARRCIASSSRLACTAAHPKSVVASILRAEPSEEGVMARYAYVNGRYVDHREASVHIEDRGYQLADGVYKVVGVHDGKLIDEAPHIDRLDRSLRELRIGWPVSRQALGFIM